MGKIVEKHPALERAYRVFRAELGSHLVAIEAILQKDEPSTEEVRDASTRSHTIKGGAGFLDLPEVASVAGDLEMLLGSVTSDIEKARELVSQLEELVKNLPPG